MLWCSNECEQAIEVKTLRQGAHKLLPACVVKMEAHFCSSWITTSSELLKICISTGTATDKLCDVTANSHKKAWLTLQEPLDPDPDPFHW